MGYIIILLILGIIPRLPADPKKFWQLGCGSILLAVMIRGGFLSIEERAALEAVMGHPSETHGVARRANAVLLLDDGLSCVEVAKVLYLDDDTVRTWLKRYRAGGLDEMTLFDWHGRSGHLSREQEAELSAHLSQRLYRDTGEVAAHIKATYGVIYSHSGCIKVMHRLGFEYKRPKSLPAQADEAEQAAFIEAYESCSTAWPPTRWSTSPMRCTRNSSPAQSMAGSRRATKWRYAGPRGASVRISDQSGHRKRFNPAR